MLTSSGSYLPLLPSETIIDVAEPVRPLVSVYQVLVEPDLKSLPTLPGPLIALIQIMFEPFNPNGLGPETVRQTREQEM